MPLGIRYKATERFYFMSGVYGEWNLYDGQYDLNNFGAKKKLRTSAFFELEYKIRPNWIIEAGYEYQLSNPKFAPLGLTPVKQNGLFKIGS